ncbi:ClcB-like voltage-gated chloride channel protein [Robbsia sp. Bb-Pol-6]|uniref:ClcB-like voltage-gated chloride channel protein n=1 Tax=Robbsia betulipollinis TaxID=2981849 RepID=A0ABT3ZMS3_9BURK|nr:ClcB-like voltage-gated chloride channel protein [Robbsia betulipollinis]MCY0387820.1 ClcB-like voltage-gated chloride channel protein [Robbsia betulipollinis]
MPTMPSRQRRIFRALRLPEGHAMLLWGALAGAIGALATIAFRDAIRLLQGWLAAGDLSAGNSDSVVELARHLAWYWRLLLPAAGGLLAGAFLLLARRIPAPAAGVDYMNAIAVGDGHVPARQSVLRAASSLFTIVSGGSIGREGSMVQIAAMSASLLGRGVRFRPERLKLLVACGAAAGITAAYNAPIAGAFFVTEIVLGSIVMERFGPIVVASVVSNIVMRAFPGYRPTYEMPAFPEVFGIEQLLFVGLGLVAGVLAPQFLRLLETSRRQFARLPAPLPLRLALGGFAVGLLSIAVPEVWGNGYSVVNSLLHHDWLWTAVLTILFFKVLATALTVGSGAVGGVFTPVLFVGAAVGWLEGAAVHALWPATTSAPFVYAMVGMGAFLAAASGAPLMAILMIFEMTLSYQAVLPLMLACVLAYFTAGGSGERSMYAIISVRTQRARAKTALRNAHMGDLIRPAQTVLPLDADVACMAALFAQHPVKYLYIVDARQHYLGVVALQDLTAALLAADALGREKHAADFVRRDLINVVTPEMSLAAGLERFIAHQGERLPAVRSLAEPVLLGAVYKTSLLDAYFRLDKDS